ncbi:MAG: hypothetical protein WDN72_08915 [Alphaproteobacteria bacterium]
MPYSTGSTRAFAGSRSHITAKSPGSSSRTSRERAQRIIADARAAIDHIMLLAGTDVVAQGKARAALGAPEQPGRGGGSAGEPQAIDALLASNDAIPRPSAPPVRLSRRLCRRTARPSPAAMP